MFAYETLRVVQEGQVLTAYLHRPDAGNAISTQMVKDLSDLMDHVDEADDVSFFVLRGSPEIFSAGIDLRDFAIDKRREVYGLQRWEQMARQLESLNKFTIAVVEGECVGGGLQLVLLCDARIAARGAVLRLNEVRLGFLPGMATFRLAKYVGLGRAKNIVLTGRPLGADEAAQMGLLDTVVEDDALEDALNESIRQQQPFHPVALQTARRLLNESFAGDYEDFLGCFLAAQHRAINSESFGRLISETLSSSDTP